MNKSFSIKHFRTLAALWMLASASIAPAQAAAPDPRLFGPWVVQHAVTQDNIGLRVYFSPDGNFFLVDPKTKLGMVGTWVFGRAGLLVNIYGNGKWAKLWDADVGFSGNDHMDVDVVDSQLAAQQRFSLLRVKY